ncbi:hypothetical protein KIL84_007443 [Mauremys mutica]|uniref:Uncharacterized protein n=1 Tax=Mauremys mutica TaxID=74926 RepID=A0A9D4AX32_9SAUR|nr:hypothetical protein KIL84_007443 [Mauremys mutica]
MLRTMELSLWFLMVQCMRIELGTKQKHLQHLLQYVALILQLGLFRYNAWWPRWTRGSPKQQSSGHGWSGCQEVNQYQRQSGAMVGILTVCSWKIQPKGLDQLIGEVRLGKAGSGKAI